MASTQDPVSSKAADRSEDWRALHEAVRSHELELTKATAAFEHAVVAPLTLLNGGAAAAWLALLEHRSALEVAPAVWWGAGLILAVLSAHVGWQRQRLYAKAERFRREALEALWLTGTPDIGTAIAVLTAGEFEKAMGSEATTAIEAVAETERSLHLPWRARDSAHQTAEQHIGGTRLSQEREWAVPRLRAAAVHHRARRMAAWFQLAVWASVGAFVVGGLWGIARL